MSPARFGQRFVGKVANPNDLLLFLKRKRFGETKADRARIEAMTEEEQLQMATAQRRQVGTRIQAHVCVFQCVLVFVCLATGKLNRTAVKWICRYMRFSAYMCMRVLPCLRAIVCERYCV